MSEWHNLGDANFGEWGGCLVKEDLDIPNNFDVFELIGPSDSGDGTYRALLHYIDVTDADIDKIRELASYNGTDIPDNADAAAAMETYGKERLAADMAESGWDSPSTYHDGDVGWNSPWRDSQRDDLKPYGQLSTRELMKWMKDLGAGEFAPKPEWSRHPNTRISYLYRDAGNYKGVNEVVLQGQLSYEEIDEILANRLEGEWFIPSQVGLPENRGGFAFDAAVDHTRFEIDENDFEPTDESPTTDVTTENLVEGFREAKEKGWDEVAAWERASGREWTLGNAEKVH